MYVTMNYCLIVRSLAFQLPSRIMNYELHMLNDNRLHSFSSQYSILTSQTFTTIEKVSLDIDTKHQIIFYFQLIFCFATKNLRRSELQTIGRAIQA